MEVGTYLETGEGIHVDWQSWSFPKDHGCQGFSQGGCQFESVPTETNGDEDTLRAKDFPHNRVPVRGDVIGASPTVDHALQRQVQSLGLPPTPSLPETGPYALIQHLSHPLLCLRL